MLRPTLEVLAAMLAGRADFTIEEGGDLRTVWRRLAKLLNPEIHQSLPAAVQDRAYELARDIAASFRHQHEFASLLDLEPQTLRRQLFRLIGKADVKSDDSITWTSLGTRGKADSMKSLVRRINSLGDDLQAIATNR